MGHGVYEISLGGIDQYSDKYFIKEDSGSSYSFDLRAVNDASIGLNLRAVGIYRLQSWYNSTYYYNNYVAVLLDVGASAHPTYILGSLIYENDTSISSKALTINSGTRYTAIYLSNELAVSALAERYGRTPTQNEYLLDTDKIRLWTDSKYIYDFAAQFGNEIFSNAETEEVDPYAGGGSSGTGGGNGNFDYTGDTIPEPSLPTIGAAATGFVSLFNPSATQLQSLIDYLWSPLFDIDTIKRLYADPMQQFIGLSLVPVPVPSAGTKTIQVGGVSTGIALTAAGAQFVSVNCGSITFNSSSLTASYLDFLPYTKTQLYLPYIGIVDVSTDDIMDKTISIKYHVDILTGGCIAYIIIGGSVMYQYSGQCAINIPLSSIDWSTTISSALNLVSSAIGGIISGSTVPLTGGAGALVGAQGIANMGASAVNAAVNAKPTINKSGAIGGSSGIMAVQKPFLIVTCPNLARAKNQDYFIGYPSFITKYISECSGFCSFEEVYLSGLGLTDDEMEELKNILKEGVYL